jgi:hypothetical protein
LWYAGLLLIATNSITNPFAHNLHGDALAQLVVAAAYLLLLRYIETRSLWILALMALVAPAGFLVKQNLASWVAWYGGFLLLWDRPWRRALIFMTTGGILCLGVAGVCYAIWGQPFFFWTVTVLSKHDVSPLRGFQHALDAWTYFAAGLLGGMAILAERKPRALFGAWLVWLALLLSETYTSGIAWMLNHMGPGSLIAGVWFFAGMAAIWDRATAPAAGQPRAHWIRAGALTAAIALMFNGMGLVRIPLRTVSEDAHRYLRDIEGEFQGLPAQRVLLDAGTWIYLKNRVVMGDRAPGFGDRAAEGVGDFSGVLSRIAAKRYSKILVRDFHDRDFIYDHYLWRKSSGIRQALLDNYHETARIAAARSPEAMPGWAEDPYYFGEITVLEPNSGATGVSLEAQSTSPPGAAVVRGAAGFSGSTPVAVR